VLAKETHEDVIRFAPPLVIGREDLDWGIDRIDETLRRVAGTHTVQVPDAVAAG
jgi:acetylornithine/succinyldiaminopimelate/putrescine aminotransferase